MCKEIMFSPKDRFKEHTHILVTSSEDVVTVRFDRVRLGLAGADRQGGGGCEGRLWPPGHHGENSGGPPAGHRLCRQDQGSK